MTDAYYDAYNAQSDIAERRQKNMLARQAGGMIAGGDEAGAANALFSGGQLDAGYGVRGHVDATRKAKAEAHAKYAQGVGTVYAAAKEKGASDQEAAEAAWSVGEQYAPRLGLDKSDLDEDKPHFLSNPQAYLTMLDAQAKKELQFFQNDQGIFAGDKATGRVTQVQKFPGKPMAMDPDKNYYLPDDGSQPQGSSGTPPNADETWARMIQRESGGQPGVLGPQTRYGQAQGMTQMLPATARDMAQKLGVPWRPDLMTAKTPEGAAYQQKLGRAYYEEGLAKYGGDQRKAAMYYHGGPDEAIWGPKTRAYGEAVAPSALQGGSGADTLGGIPGYRQIQRAQPKREGAPSGFRWKADGSLEPIPGGPADTISEGGKVTEGERTAGFLAARLADSLTNLTAISRTDPAARKPGLKEVVAQNMPYVGGEGAANLVRNADRQQVVANQLDVLDAALTLGTGAAYTKEQLVNYRNVYFPSLTDKPETVRAKGRKLIALLESAKIKAGRSAPPALDAALADAKAQYAGSAGKAAAPAQGGGSPPASALKADHITTFANGQRWTLRGGKPVRVQ